MYTVDREQEHKIIPFKPEVDSCIESNLENSANPYGLLKEVFEKSTLTNEKLSELMGVSDKYLPQVFEGKLKPTRDALICFCSVFSSTVEITQQLLQEYGFAQLYVKNQRDEIILNGLANRWPLEKINNYLYAKNEYVLW